MEHTTTDGGVTNPAVESKYEGVALDPGKYRERPGLNRRMIAAGQDPAAMRRLIARKPVAS